MQSSSDMPRHRCINNGRQEMARDSQSLCSPEHHIRFYLADPTPQSNGREDVIQYVESTPIRRTWVEVDLYKDRKFKSVLEIAPYITENYGNIHWARLFYECDKRDIKVEAWGNSNNFPLMAMIAHKVIHRPFGLKGMFDPDSVYATHDWVGLRIKFKFRGRKDYFWSFDRQSCPYFKLRVLRRITVEQLVDFYRDRPIFMRADTNEFFNELAPHMERNIVVTHVKSRSFEQVMSFLEPLRRDYRIRGIGDQYNENLLEACHGDFMGVQILGSIHLGWRYIGISGSANLFGVIPVNSVLLAEQQPYWLPESGEWKSAMNQLLYGSPTSSFTFPWSLGDHPRDLIDHLPKIRAALGSLPMQYRS